MSCTGFVYLYHSPLLLIYIGRISYFCLSKLEIIEVPEDIVDEMTEVLKDCMSKAGGFFCRKLKLPADSEVGNYWIH